LYKNNVIGEGELPDIKAQEIQRKIAVWKGGLEGDGGYSKNKPGRQTKEGNWGPFQPAQWHRKTKKAAFRPRKNRVLQVCG